MCVSTRANVCAFICYIKFRGNLNDLKFGNDLLLILSIFLCIFRMFTRYGIS